MLTLKTTLVSLQSLLCSPEPKDPQDAVVAKHYMDDLSGYEKKAREWTHLYADGPKPNGAPAASSSAAPANGIRPAAAPAPPRDEAIARGLDPRHVDQVRDCLSCC